MLLLLTYDFFIIFFFPQDNDGQVRVHTEESALGQDANYVLIQTNLSEEDTRDLIEGKKYSEIVKVAEFILELS